jgi:hypothetical protein
MSALAPQLGGKQKPGERAENDASDPMRTSTRATKALSRTLLPFS